VAKKKNDGAVAVRATVRGAAQGVGFRDATVNRARELGVLGWVRNGEEGDVLVHAEGPEPAVESLLAFLREGPPAARVEEVASESVKATSSSRSAGSAPASSSSRSMPRPPVTSICGSRSTG
jgi:acylphosphatase